MKAIAINKIIAEFLNCPAAPRFRIEYYGDGTEDIIASNYPFYTRDINLLLPAYIKIALNYPEKNISLVLNICDSSMNVNDIKHKAAEDLANLILKIHN